MEKPKPDINVNKVATEIKLFIDKKKMDMIDYGYTKIQAFPNPEDPDYPELSKFAAQWNAFFDYADAQPEFPEELVAEFEAANTKVAEAVNGDAQFWEAIRQKVLPLYEKSPAYEAWKRRWSSVGIWYYPEAFPIATTMKWMVADAKTKQIKRQHGESELVSSRVLPPGFVIEVH